MTGPRLGERLGLAGEARKGVGRHEDDHPDDEIGDDADEQNEAVQFELAHGIDESTKGLAVRPR